jgi:hypothetical protein
MMHSRRRFHEAYLAAKKLPGLAENAMKMIKKLYKFEDGRFEIDNGWIERAIRKFAIGRNNWLFCDTVDGAKASSFFTV